MEFRDRHHIWREIASFDTVKDICGKIIFRILSSRMNASYQKICIRDIPIENRLQKLSACNLEGWDIK